MLQIGCICQYNISIPNNHRFFIIMRQIETNMNNAIRSKKNFSSSNTTVQTFCDLHGEESKVFLHGNHIATYNHTLKELELFDGGWQSNTTKSRLNALINEFCDGTKTGVFQKNWTWFVKAFGITTVFHNGISIPLI